MSVSLSLTHPFFFFVLYSVACYSSSWSNGAGYENGLGYSSKEILMIQMKIITICLIKSSGIKLLNTGVPFVAVYLFIYLLEMIGWNKIR